MKNRILLIDDDLITVELIQKALSKQNYEVIATDKPKEALKLFLENPALVVLSDLNMPEMNGDELMSRIFQSGHKPIFLMLTGETDVNKAVELFKQGIHDYIIKPFSLEELLCRIEVFLRRSTETETSTLNDKMFQLGQYSFDAYNLTLRTSASEKTLTQKSTHESYV